MIISNSNSAAYSPDCTEIWQAGARDWEILEIHLQSNPRRLTAGHSAKVALVFNRITVALI